MGEEYGKWKKIVFCSMFDAYKPIIKFAVSNIGSYAVQSFEPMPLFQ
jgi:hypothetical protein